MARTKGAAAGQRTSPDKRKAKLLAKVPSPVRQAEPDRLPPRLEKYLDLADATLAGGRRQRSVIDVQPVFQPPKPPRVHPPQRTQPTRPPLTLPKPPKSPKPLSTLPQKRARP